MRLVRNLFRLGAVLTLASTAAAPAFAAEVVARPAPQSSCSAPAELTRIAHPLPRTARKLAAKSPIKIVAVGSSSTFGAGASSAAMSYPSRLQVELKRLLRGTPVSVVNRGVNGENARDMLARFDTDVIAENPDIVVWQVGSNSVLQQLPISPAKTTIREGLKKLKAGGIDIILMNPQYAPKVISKRNIERMVELINATAKEDNVDLFQRYAVMRHWRLTAGMPFSAFLSPDELHLNDWSYGCIARMLGESIAEAANRPTLTAGAIVPRR